MSVLFCSAQPDLTSTIHKSNYILFVLSSFPSIHVLRLFLLHANVVVEVKNKLIVTMMSSRINAHACSHIIWFIFKLPRKNKLLKVHTQNSKWYNIFLFGKPPTWAMWIKTGVDLNVWHLCLHASWLLISTEIGLLQVRYSEFMKRISHELALTPIPSSSMTLIWIYLHMIWHKAESRPTVHQLSWLDTPMSTSNPQKTQKLQEIMQEAQLALVQGSIMVFKKGEC